MSTPTPEQRTAAAQRAMVRDLSEAILAMQAEVSRRDAELTVQGRAQSTLTLPHEEYTAAIIGTLTDLTRALLTSSREEIAALLKGLSAGRASDYADAASVAETHRALYAHGASIGFAAARLRPTR